MAPPVVEARTFLFLNGRQSNLAAGITAEQTTVTLTNGGVMPAPGASEIFTLVLRNDALGWFEVMYVTARSGDTLTVERGKEDTIPQAWPVGTIARHAMTEGLFIKLTALDPRNFLTSRPYPYEAHEAYNNEPGIVLSSDPNYVVNIDGLDTSGAPTTGTMRELLLRYTTPVEDLIDITSGVVNGALDIVASYETYSNWPIEAIDMASGVGDGTMVAVLVQYERYQIEEMDLGHNVISGELT